VFILNTEGAVRAFSLGGNVTLGANLSVAAGPVGRSAEGAGTIANLAPIYAYSKTKGLFAG
jgi:SH3 domain-containing YSC84-like protein 1